MQVPAETGKYRKLKLCKFDALGDFMKKIKILLAESNYEEKNALKEIFNKENKFEIVSCVEDGEEALSIANDYKVDVVVCNFALKKVDGITLCEKLKARENAIKMVMLSSAYSDFAIKRMVDSGVDFYCLRPFESQNLIRQILFMFDNATPNVENIQTHETVAAQKMSEFPLIASKRLETNLADIFIEIGIPANIKGFTFLREAVRLTMQTPAIINAITKQLYPSIAEIHGTSPTKVERAIRHAIEVSVSRGKIEILNEIFNVKAFNVKDKPTNGEFIALIAEKLLIEGIGA